MLLPANIPLEGVIGATFDASVQLFSDAAETIPFDLTGYNVPASTLVVDGVATLAVGAGLTIDQPTAIFTATMTPAQTAIVTVNGSRYRLKLLTASGREDIPVYGQINWTTP